MVAVGQEVEAWVVSVDSDNKRFGLSLRAPGSEPPSRSDFGGDEASGMTRPARVATRGALRSRDGGEASASSGPTLSAKKGDWVQGTVKSVQPFGAIVEVEPGVSGLLHVSEMSDKPDPRPEDLVKVGDSVRVRIDKVERDKGAERIRLSMMEHFDVRSP